MRIALLAFAFTCISACSAVGFPGVYRIDVEQGNIVTREMADQLQPGMSRRQVRFILGTPLVEDPFNQHRWDYPYRRSNGTDILDNAQFTVVFDGDSLAEIRGDYVPVVFGGTPPPELAPQAAPETMNSDEDGA
jgi:outer membrane protein assembly factor BamE